MTNELPMDPHVKIEADRVAKVVHLHFRGRVTASEVQQHAELFRITLQELGPGFRLLTDLTGLEEMEIDSVREVTRLMDESLKQGVKEVVRVIPEPDKDIGFHLLSMTHYRGRVPVTTCASLEEARRVLGAVS